VVPEPERWVAVAPADAPVAAAPVPVRKEAGLRAGFENRGKVLGLEAGSGDTADRK